ncbi:DUF3021 family protein [Ligilactobacillus araffinosus]|uniref:Integral membrane protein n=1 Tax=Ligilactobacillus araffinosus DSM 20653 TaxID=1423820 RepID=A0A0R1ZM63_9LACO|nr:DUF3021 family protein [Ligilactobacillus araffinosus]KRM52035.1 hypothetical protein FC64_GL001230 [Ligilactobacillus araffinosus DSM 20653]
MRWLIELLQRMIIGIEIGITCYVWIGVTCYSSVKLTLPIATDISLMGAVIGIATIVFRIPQLNYYFAFLIHYLIVLAASWIFLKPIYKVYYGINYQFNFQSILFIAVVYLIIQLVIRFMQINEVQRVNRRLKQKQKNNH